MNDESDLPLLTSITLGRYALGGDDICNVPYDDDWGWLLVMLESMDSGSLIMKSIDEMMILIDRSPFSIYTQRR